MIQKTKRSIEWIVQNKPFFLSKKKKYAGVHLTAEFWNGKIVEDIKELKKVMWGAARAAQSTPLRTTVYKFSPQGITGVVLLAESHVAIHTWPELGYAAIDIFTCGDKAVPMKALNYFKEAFQPERVEIKQLNRGRIE